MPIQQKLLQRYFLVILPLGFTDYQDVYYARLTFFKTKERPDVINLDIFNPSSAEKLRLQSQTFDIFFNKEQPKRHLKN